MHNKLINNKRKAFTLVELLIVIAIIGILFIVLVSKVDFATDKAKATGVQTDFRSFQVAIESVAKENAGLATFGWDTGDANGDRIRNSYDKGDTNQNGKQDPGEVFVGSKTYGETWTNVYTLTNPADANDKSAIVALEEAINKNLDPKLHITINDDLTITMANGAKDPWNTEYHGYYITNAEVDGKDRGAIVIYSNGANQEWGSEHSIAGGVVVVNVPGNNVYGKDDYGIAVVYTYVNGYGEVKAQTSGFSQNQEATSNSNNSSNGGNADDLNNVPVIGDTKQFATLITSSTLKDIYDLSTSPDKEYGQATLLFNDETYLWISLVDGTTYSMYYEFYNASEDCLYCYAYATEGIVNLGYVPESGWYAIDNDSGEGIKSNAPCITFVQDMEISMPNGLEDLMPLFTEHKHSYHNCRCDCGDVKHNIGNNGCSDCNLNQYGFYYDTVYFGVEEGYYETSYFGLVFYSDGTISMTSNAKDPNVLFAWQDKHNSYWNNDTRTMTWNQYYDSDDISHDYFVISEDGLSVNYMSDWNEEPTHVMTLTPRFDLVVNPYKTETPIYNQFGDLFVFHNENSVSVTDHETGETHLYTIVWHRSTQFHLEGENAHRYGGELFIDFTGKYINTVWYT